MTPVENVGSLVPLRVMALGSTNPAEHFSLEMVSLCTIQTEPFIHQKKKNSVCFVKDYPFINTVQGTERQIKGRHRTGKKLAGRLMLNGWE